MPQGEIGSNGLSRAPNGDLMVPQHGNRAVARYPRDAFLSALQSNQRTNGPEVLEPVATEWNGKRFNSPNDGIAHSNGNYFFTDPAWGLELFLYDPLNEMGGVQGVYMWSEERGVELVSPNIQMPNGIGLSPDEKTLYVNNGDFLNHYMWKFDLDSNGRVQGEGEIFLRYNETGDFIFDGMCVRSDGIIFSTSPNGVLIVQPDGTMLGYIRSDKDVFSNCIFDEDESYIYITNTNRVLRMKLK